MTLAERMLEDSQLRAEAEKTEQAAKGIKASELIALFQQALDEKWGYIWGTRGQVWTQASQDRATRDMTIQYGQKWVGRKVADCSGMFVWAYKQHGLTIYHGSNTIWKKYCSRQGALSAATEIKPGAAVFTVSDGVRGHIGLYIGNGKCIEAKGTKSGVVMSDLSRWHEWGELTEVDYDLPAEKIEVAPRTMRKGDSGADVQELQGMLVAAGYDIGKRKDGTPLVDGIYGGETVSAVRAYQFDHGLTPDGIAGPKTMAALKASAPDEPDEPDETGSPKEEETQPLTIEQRLMRLEQAVFGEGGESNG